LIRHAGSDLPVAVIPLTIAVVGFAVIGLLVFAIRFTSLPPSSFLPAVITAITMSTITTTADVENNRTTNTPASTKNNFRAFPPHPHSVAGWTSGWAS
jgi:hypothetical protein